MKHHKFGNYVKQLKGWREAVFILALAQRAAPNYQLFAEAVDLAGAEAVAPNLASFWQLLAERIPEATLVQWLDALHDATPQEQAYDLFGVYPASDFCALYEQALLAQINPDKARGQEAAERSLQTVMTFLEMSQGEGLPDHKLIKLFDNSPLMKRELEFQKDLVYRLRKQAFPSASFLAELCELATDEGVSNIGICLADEEVQEVPDEADKQP